MLWFVSLLLLSLWWLFLSHTNAYQLCTVTCVIGIVKDCWSKEGNVQQFRSLCFSAFLTSSMEVLSNLTAINSTVIYSTTNRRFLKSGVKKKYYNDHCCYQPVLNPLWKEPIINGSLIIIGYKGAKLINFLTISTSRQHYFAFIIFDCSHRQGEQLSKSTGWESVWICTLFRNQAGLCSEILWNRSSRGHLRQGNWADYEAGLQ